MTQHLISGSDVWTRLNEILPSRKAVQAAVAYATTDVHLRLGHGDNIVVNASLAKVRQGITNPSLLGKWLTAGVAVSTNSSLHAKLITCGRWTVVGSANLSERANRATEAVYLSTDPELQKQAKRFLGELAADSEQLDLDWVGRMSPLYGLDRQNDRDAPLERRTRSILPKTFQRLVISHGYYSTRRPPPYVAKVTPSVGERARFSPLAHPVGVGTTSIRGTRLNATLTSGDLLIWVDSQTGSMNSPQLVTARPNRPGEGSKWVVTMADSQLADGLDAARLPSHIHQVLEKHGMMILDSPSSAAPVLKLWGLQP
jgi:hypothetical protein